MKAPSFAWVGQEMHVAEGFRLEELYPEEAILAAAGRIAASRRQSRRGASPHLLPCPICYTQLTARQRRRPCPTCGGRQPRA